MLGFIHHNVIHHFKSWWHHIMEMLSTLLALCEGNLLITRGFSSQKACNEDLSCFLSCKPAQAVERSDAHAMSLYVTDIRKMYHKLLRNIHMVHIYYFLWLTHWGRVRHICVSKLSIIGSDNGLSPGRRQAIIRNNAGILLIGPLGTNFNEILIEIYTFPFTKMHLKISSGKWRPFCLGLNVLNNQPLYVCHAGLLHRHSMLQPWRQCCPKTVTRLPNATNKWNGQPILAHWVVHFATNEFQTDFSQFNNNV